jgi:type IV pilus assembly protein PilF
MNRKLAYRLIVASLISILSACAPDPPPEFVAWPAQERAQTQIELGYSYLHRDLLDTARESFQTAIQVDPDASEAYHGLGLVEAKALNLDKAMAYLGKSVALDGQNIPAVSDYAIMLCREGVASKGVAVLQKNVKELSQLGVATRLAFGRCYQADNQPDKAIAAYQSVLEIEPDLPQALLSMARLKFERQNYLSASAFLQRYFYTNTISSDALLLAANVEQLLNNPEERDYYTQILWSRYPRSEQAHEARELYSQ